MALYFLAGCLFRVVVVELFSVFLCQRPSNSVSLGTSHKMKHPQITRIYFYSYNFCVKDKDNQRRKKLKIKCQESLLQKNNCEFLKIASKSDGERDFAGHEMHGSNSHGRRKYWISGWIVAPHPRESP